MYEGKITQARADGRRLFAADCCAIIGAVSGHHLIRCRSIPSLELTSRSANKLAMHQRVSVARLEIRDSTSDLQQSQKSTNIQAYSKGSGGHTLYGLFAYGLFCGTPQFHRGQTWERRSSDKNLTQQDYYSALAPIVMASARNNAQLRRKIYELARSKLRQQLQRDANVGHSERARQLMALEAAIDEIEANLAENNFGETYSGVNVSATNPQSRMEIIPPGQPLRPLSDARYEFTATYASRPTPSRIRSALMLVGAAILAGAAYVAIQRGLREAPQMNLAANSNIFRNGNPPSTSLPFPHIQRPSAYGVYALINGKLSELEALPIRVPDQRVAISATISSPSSTKLPTGQAQFIAFQRDLLNNAPEKVTVRIVAKIISAAGLGNKGGATKSNLGGSWAVRNISYEMKVAPVDGNPAMILIRPAEASFSFPPGRYVLVLKNVAYDFSVEGPISDAAQCIERVDESEAPVFTECPKL
jgi:hypothetical protein